MESVPHSAPPRRVSAFPIGTRFGRLSVCGEPFTVGQGRKTRLYYPCRCVCGHETKVRQDGLVSGSVASCGCGQRDAVVRINTTHGEARTRLYIAYRNIIQRCLNPNYRCYADYGGRGITVCDEWRASYEAFRDWSLANGYDDNLEIDRIDNDGPYSPGNCRWTTRGVQVRNTRQNRIYSAFGETKCIADWVTDPRCCVGRSTLMGRLNSGWDIARALTTPPRPTT